MLLVLDRQQRAKDLYTAIKIKALDRAIDTKRLRALFPENFAPEDPFAAAQQSDGTYDPDLVDEDEIRFSVPRDADEDEEISAWIRDREQGTVSASMITDWV